MPNQKADELSECQPFRVFFWDVTPNGVQHAQLPQSIVELQLAHGALPGFIHQQEELEKRQLTMLHSFDDTLGQGGLTRFRELLVLDQILQQLQKVGVLHQVRHHLLISQLLLQVELINQEAPQLLHLFVVGLQYRQMLGEIGQVNFACAADR